MPTPFTPVQDQIFAYFPIGTHPWRWLSASIEENLTPDSVVLDIGCGRAAPNLAKLVGKARHLYGIDLVPFTVENPELQLHNCSVCEMPEIASETVDLAYSRAVMEHIEDVDAAFAEISRVLKPGGRYIFLTPSIYDYASIIAALTPNSWHPKVVRWATGRKEEDVFPTFFRCNSRRRIGQLATRHGLDIVSFEYLGQYPAYFMFNRTLFWLGCMYEKLLEKVKLLAPLRGSIFCILEKPVEPIITLSNGSIRPSASRDQRPPPLTEPRLLE